MGSIFSSFLSFAHQKQQYRCASLPCYYEQPAASICTAFFAKNLAADSNLHSRRPRRSSQKSSNSVSSSSSSSSSESSSSFKLSLDLNLNLTTSPVEATAYTENQQHRPTCKAKQTKVNSSRRATRALLKNVLVLNAQQQEREREQEKKGLDVDESLVKVRVKVSEQCTGNSSRKSRNNNNRAGTAQKVQTQEQHRQREQKNKDNSSKAAITTSTMRTKTKPSSSSSKSATKTTRTSCIPELDDTTPSTVTTTTPTTITFDNFNIPIEKHVDLTSNSTTIELKNKKMTILPNLNSSSLSSSSRHSQHQQQHYNHHYHHHYNQAYHQQNNHQQYQHQHQHQQQQSHHQQHVQNRNARSGKSRVFHNRRAANRSPCSSAISSCSISSTSSSSRSSSNGDQDELVALAATRFTLDPRFRLPPTHHAWHAWASSLTGPVTDHPSHYPEPPKRTWIFKRQNKQTSPSSFMRGQQQQQQSANQPEFTALSYNVLCDRMVSRDSFPASPEMALNWFYRRELILRQLLEYNPDIIALQELELEQYETFFKPYLEGIACYDSIFEPKSRAKTMDNQWRQRVDGCAIFFKAEKFSLIKSHLLEFSQIAMANAQGSEAMLNRVMTKDNIGLVAVLEFTQQKQRQRLLVCNTHIHWDPECCDVKLIQTIMLMNELECIAKQNSIANINCRSPGGLTNNISNINNGSTNNNELLLPLVLLGDFNSMPNSGVTSYLTAGKINSLHDDFKNFKYTTCSNVLAASLITTDDTTTTASNTSRRQSSPAWCYYNQHYQQPSPGSSPSSSSCTSFSSSEDPPVLNYNHPFKLTSSYEKDVMPYTNYTTTFKAVIDYIFYSQDSIQLLGLLGPLDKHWVKGNRIRGFPQVHVPSDHLPLLVKFRLTSYLGSTSVNLSPPPKTSRRNSNFSIKQNYI